MIEINVFVVPYKVIVVQIQRLGLDIDLTSQVLAPLSCLWVRTLSFYVKCMNVQRRKTLLLTLLANKFVCM